MDPETDRPASPPSDMEHAHRRLHELAEEVEATVERGELRLARWKLETLIDEAGAHFLLEERLMRESAYPEADAHAAVHAEHVAELHKLRKELAQHGLSPLFKLWFGSRFAGWMRSHVRGMDQALERHLRRWAEAQAAAPQPPPGTAAPPAKAP